MGRRFGRLTVIGEAEPYVSPAGKKTRRIVCKCDCGKETTVLRNTLGRTANSCGCLQKERAREALKIDLTGQTFGRLQVIDLVDLPKPEATGCTLGWRCRCECGNEVILPTRYLLHGKGTKSCGCLLKDTARDKVKVKNVLGRVPEGTMLTLIKSDKPYKNNKSGARGVYWNEREQTWRVNIGYAGKTILLGRRKNFSEAVKLRKEGEEKYFAPILDKYADGVDAAEKQDDQPKEEA